MNKHKIRMAKKRASRVVKAHKAKMKKRRVSSVKASAMSMLASLPEHMKPSLELADVTRKRYEYEIQKAKKEGKEPPKYMERLCAYSDEEIIGCFAAYFTVVDEALLKNDRYANDFLDRCLEILCAFNPKFIDRLKERKSCLLDTEDDEFCSSLIQDGCPEVLAQSVSCLLHALYDLSGYASQLICGLGGEPIAQMFMNISSEFIRNRAESMSAVLQEAWGIQEGWEENLRDRIDYLEQRNLEASYAFAEGMRNKDIVQAAEIDRLNEEHAKAMAEQEESYTAKIAKLDADIAEKESQIAEQEELVSELRQTKKEEEDRYQRDIMVGLLYIKKHPDGYLEATGDRDKPFRLRHGAIAKGLHKALCAIVDEYKSKYPYLKYPDASWYRRYCEPSGGGEFNPSSLSKLCGKPRDEDKW